MAIFNTLLKMFQQKLVDSRRNSETKNHNQIEFCQCFSPRRKNEKKKKQQTFYSLNSWCFWPKRIVFFLQVSHQKFAFIEGKHQFNITHSIPCVSCKNMFLAKTASPKLKTLFSLPLNRRKQSCFNITFSSHLLSKQQHSNNFWLLCLGLLNNAFTAWVLNGARFFNI